MTYPTKHDAIFSTLMEHFGIPDEDGPALAEMADLTSEIVAALAQVKPALTVVVHDQPDQRTDGRVPLQAVAEAYEAGRMGRFP